MARDPETAGAEGSGERGTVDLSVRGLSNCNWHAVTLVQASVSSRGG